ncbi:MAG: zinc ABC transporter substrate-binding protein [Deltaproteobacteria bacterium]|nr:zinc ABC transporter substrate-binding protein [Deltaproteobacteria bacterium]
MASLFPLQEFAGAVGGDRIQATLLLPPGAEVHTWEPKPSDVVKIAQADVFIYIGPSMEPWVDKVLKTVQAKDLKVVEASRGLPLLEADDGGGKAKGGRSEKLDPHVWLDFTLALNMVDAIAVAFSEKDPMHAPFYRNNAENYKAKLRELDQKYLEALAKCRHRYILLSGHAAFAYLARRYGLQQISLSGVSPNAEPTPKRMAQVLQATQKHGIKYIYSEELVNRRLSQALAKEAKVSVLVLHPGHNLTREEVQKKMTFLGLMEMNLRNLKRGLECEEQ